MPSSSANISRARSSLLPRYSPPGSRSCSSQARAASVRRRWWRSRSRSSSSQPDSRGQQVIRASWASWTPSSSAVSSRARAQPLDHLRRLRVGPLGEIGAGQRAPGVGGAPARLDQPQQQMPGGARLGLGQLLVHLLRRRRDRAAHPAGRLVRGQGEHPALAPPPGLQQRVREHGQPAGLVDDLPDDPRGQLPLHQQSGGLRRLGHRRPQFVGRHRSEQQPGTGQRVRQAPVLGAAGVEVGPYADQHPQPAVRIAGGEQQVDEAGPFLAVPAQGEGLLELVDHHPALRLVLGGGQQVAVRLRGPRARGEHPQHRRAAAAGDLLAQGGDQPGPQQRGLAAAGRPEQHREPVVAHQPVQLLDHAVPAEEQMPVGGLEAGQAPVRRCAVRGLLADRLGDRRLRLLPADLPLGRVTAAGPDVPLGDGQGRQPFAGRGLRQRCRGEAGPLRHAPVRGAARGLAHLAEVVGEPGDGAGRRVQGSFWTAHAYVPPHSRRNRRQGGDHTSRHLSREPAPGDVRANERRRDAHHRTNQK
ncbi:putative WD-40 repeat protein [Streptomyces viridochromogenes Tue57]|uniref:Putative WD-40 repeat protein n=1 Tax=Streptomyces viridochromogenes Tue57 TaxID=1160705 RepID=L8PHD0_STRVR|nr:putative WD-40 repeat protein [Streptomyces viridochromogenes Tue57]